MHPEKHNAHVKAYYNRNLENILMQKADNFEGNTKRFHRQTLIRLANAGFDVLPSQTATSGIDQAETPVHTLSAFAGIEVS
jgi:hypothetical protein